MIADSQTAGALLEYICRHPAEDDARLAYADLLEERGEDEHAEFIRTQVALASWPCECDGEERVYHDECRCGEKFALRRRERELFTWNNIEQWFGHALWERTTTDPAEFERLHDTVRATGITAVLIRRGFIAEITLTAEAFAGGPCQAFEAAGYTDHSDCPRCRGTGKTPGHAAALFRVAPIEKVTLSDREPRSSPRGTRIVFWFVHATDGQCLEDPSYVPDALWKTGALGEYGQSPTRQAALNALASAALLLGRRRGWPCPECWGTGNWRDRLNPPTYDRCPSCAGTGHTVTA